MSYCFIYGLAKSPEQQVYINQTQQAWIEEIGKEHIRCLHVGCGEKHLPWAVNIDPNPSRAAWRDYPDDVHDLSRWPDGCFGSAISNHVIPALRDPVAAFRELARVLRPGGVMAHVIPDHTYAPRRCDQRFPFDVQHHSWSSAESFQVVMDQVGDLLRVERLEHFPTFNFSFRVLAVRL